MSQCCCLKLNETINFKHIELLSLLQEVTLHSQDMVLAYRLCNPSVVHMLKGLHTGTFLAQKTIFFEIRLKIFDDLQM